MPQVAFIDADLQVRGAEMTVLELIEKVKAQEELLERLTAQEEQIKAQEERILELETIVAALY